MLIGLYSIGLVVAISGLSYGAHILHMPTHWIVICSVVLLGAGIVNCWTPSEPTEFPDEDCYR